MKTLLFVMAGLAAFSLVACTPKPTQEASIIGQPRPKTINDQGQPTDIRFEAQDEFGKPGSGTVTVTAPFGEFDNGTTETEVKLDSAGVGWATYRCSSYKDLRCSSAVTLTASWKNATAVSVRFRTIEFEIPLIITGCGPISKAVPPIVRKCAPVTDNECDGATDVFLSANGVPGDRVNQGTGNGFDDDCDGLADEGCSCPQSGTTKACQLVPATQTNGQGELVGWCAKNAVGSVDCAGSGDNANTWSGVCRGAQQPAVSDSCNTGDFNCDGLDKNNSNEGCSCKTLELRCPQDPIVLAPFPNPSQLTPIFGGDWIVDPAARAQAKNWKWSAIGGDCDNVLPNPTFGLFNNANTKAMGARIGVKAAFNVDNTVTPPRLNLVLDGGIRGLNASANTTSTIYPAFALSGDYLVQGQFTFENTTYSCTQKVQVRSPGVRFELCWDMAGGSRDVDLHVAKAFGACPTNGWDDRECDCNYKNTNPSWNYSASPAAACSGWGSTRGVGAAGDAGCNNPRLDKDNVSCSLTETDPNAMGFCAPENINIDQPNDLEKFVVMANYFSGSFTTPVHVNMYCNGQRVASVGANPATRTTFPRLLKSGSDVSGDMWTVGTLQAHVRNGNLESCTVETIPSRIPDPTRDGTSAYCVDSTTRTDAGVISGYSSRAFVDPMTSQGLPAGSLPTVRTQWCKH